MMFNKEKKSVMIVTMAASFAIAFGCTVCCESLLTLPIEGAL